MIDENAFNELVDAIKALGYDEATAAHYAMLIGDTPVLEDGKTIVEQDNVIIARLDLKMFR